MKDPERLGTTGSDEERRLLQAAQSVRVPDRIKDQVRRAVEARLQRRPPRRRLLMATAGVLVAASAAAAGLAPLWRALESPPPRVAPAPAPTLVQHPTILPLPAPPPAPQTHPVASHAVRPPAPETRPAPPVPVSPELDLQGYLHAPIEVARPPAPPPPPPPARLLIERSDRRPVTMTATATTIRGSMRGRTVALTLEGKDLTGHIGEDAVSIHIFLDREAHGHVGGRELHFRFLATDTGWIVDSSLPDVGGQVRLEPGMLSFRPGCDRTLAPVANHPGLYEGTCSDDTRLRVEVPPGFLDPIARLVVLSMLLPEPEPMLRGQVPGLFPPP
jgi:hypothetical protein